jgi:hypothetical protein
MKKERIAHGSDASSATDGSPYQSNFSVEEDASRLFMPTSEPPSQLQHVWSPPIVSPPAFTQDIDPILMQAMPHSAGSIGGNPFFQSSIPPSTPYTQSHFQSTSDGQSSTISGFDTFNSNVPGFTSANTAMSPPQISADTMFKRQKYGTFSESPGAIYSDAYSPNTGSPTPYIPYHPTPLTPASVSSEGAIVQGASTSQDSALSSPDTRRVSVQSLVNDFQTERRYSNNIQGESGRQYPIADSASTTYGYDLGLPDLDTPRNNDYAAIAVHSPQSNTASLDDETPYGSAEPGSKVMAFEKGGYYAKPVPIRISKSLEPLPPLLMENHMNLLYFHHFLNHTARVLIPHGCETNPFRHILPKSKHLQNKYLPSSPLMNKHH